MLRLALLFAVLALILGALGFSGVVTGTLMQLAWILFVVFIVLFIVSALAGALRGAPPV